MAQPLRVALTGGLATGKSYCLAGFARFGAAVIDADAVAREVVEPGTPGLAAVLERFGPAVAGADGGLDRERLAQLVFRDDAARRDLEGIIHPRVYERLEAWFHTIDAPVGMAEIPLLYESGRAAAFDRVIVAACTPEEQKRRAIARGGVSAADVERRIAAQWPIDEKRKLADFVVDTSGTPGETDGQIDAIWRQLNARR
jgi:dephospho-CoA kinase